MRGGGGVDIGGGGGGIFNWGADCDWRNTPYEMGLERLVDLDRGGEFVARDALRRIRDSGVRQRIVGVEIEGDPIPLNSVKWPLRTAGGATGRVTSALWSPRLKKNIGYAWVPAAESEPGSSLVIETEHGRRPATIVPMPFVDPGKH